MTPPPRSAAPGSLGTAAAIAQALAARICHDLGGPVGAVANGADLLSEVAPGVAGAELGMIADSARRAAGMLAFHRLAFGLASTESAPVARADLLETLAVLFPGSRVGLSVRHGEGPPLARPAARAAALSSLCARGLLGMRGAVLLTLPEGVDLPVETVAEGADPARRAVALAHLAGEAPDGQVDPRLVEFVLLPGLAAAAGGRLTTEIAEARVRLRIEPG